MMMNMKVNGKMIRDMGTEIGNVAMEIIIQANGVMTCHQAKVYLNGQLANHTLETLHSAKEPALVQTTIQMELPTKANGKMINEMDKESMRRKMEILKKETGLTMS